MKNFVTGLIAGFAVIGVLCLTLAISTAFWYYFGNFVLSVFNTGYEITWAQAFAVSVMFSVVRGIFKNSKE